MIRAANQAIAISIPTLAAVIVFAVYAALGNSQEAATIWTTLSLLNLLRLPLMALPKYVLFPGPPTPDRSPLPNTSSLSAITDAHSALKRLTPVR